MVEKVAGTGISEPIGQFASATASVEVTPSDTTKLQFKGLYVGTVGDVVIKHRSDGPDITYVAVSGFAPISGVRVMLATTATDIVAMNW